MRLATISALGLALLTACPPATDDDTDTGVETDHTDDTDTNDTDTDTGGDTHTGDTDTDTDTDTGPIGPVEATAVDIQTGNIAEHTMVSVSGLVVTAVGSDGVWAQQPGGGKHSGLWVYTKDRDISGVERGDTVDVIGEYYESDGLAQVDTTVAESAFSETGAGAAPTPESIEPKSEWTAAEWEEWEGVLVSVNACVVLPGSDSGGGYSADPDADHWVFQCTNPLLMKVDDQYYTGALGTDFSGVADKQYMYFSTLSGVLNYSFGAYKLELRDSADVTLPSAH